jgi:hypothetical protein
MKRGAQIAFGFSVLFFFLFLLGITDAGQTILRGRISPTVSHWELDDIWMGAALAPWVYGLAPAVVLGLIGSGLLAASRLRVRAAGGEISGKPQ